MKNYQNGKIYELLFLDTNEAYVGHTVQPLKDRLSQHKINPVSLNIKKAFETNQNYKIVLIEKYPCNDCEELRQREQYWIEQKKPNLNVSIAYSSPERKMYLKQIQLVNDVMKREICKICNVSYTNWKHHHVSIKHIRNTRK